MISSVATNDPTAVETHVQSAYLAMFPEGDRLFVYSDGAVEAQSSDGDEFGEERLLALLEATAHLAPGEALPEIEAAIQNHSGVALFDDCTLFMASLR